MDDILRWESKKEARDMGDGGITLLRTSSELPMPAPKSSGPAAKRFRRYYETQQKAFFQRCSTVLLPAARRAAEKALAESRPLPCFSAELTFTVTLVRGPLLSLHTDLREQTARQTRRFRWGDTWDLRSGFLLPLEEFFPDGRELRAALLRAAEAQQRTGQTRYAPGWEKALKRHLNPRSFNLTEDGVELFYPQHVLSGFEHRLPLFILPLPPGK